MIALLLIACAQSQARPQESRASQLARQSFERALEQAGIRVEMRGTVRVPGSDPINIRAIAWQRKDGLLFLEYKATGKVLRYIVRYGDRAIIWHPIREIWIPADELGEGAAGLGIQNPRTILKTLAGLNTDARIAQETEDTLGIDVSLDGKGLKPLLEELVADQKVAWSKTSAKGSLLIDPKTGLLRRVRTEARLVLSEGDVATYDGMVEVKGYGEVSSYTFRKPDPTGRTGDPIPFGVRAKKLLGLPTDP